MIESALASPRAGFGGQEQYPDLPSKAAVLTYALAKSQACADGNKRLAVILLFEFLALNDATLDVGQDELADEILRVAASDRTERHTLLQELENWFRDVLQTV